jgi:hypothetical protein
VAKSKQIIINPATNLVRIKLIDQFLGRGGGDINAMLAFVNKALLKAGKSTIKIRMLQYAKKALEDGDFEHSKQDLPKAERKKLFKIECINNFYSYSLNSARPVFGELDEEERLTVPFLMGILNNYSSLPAVKVIMEGLSERFELENTESKCASIVINSQPRLENENQVIKLVIKILGHIKRSECIHFHYIAVTSLDISIEKAVEHKVAPMQIRLYENLYYLTAVNHEKNTITNYRIDQIRNLRVDELLNENEEAILFDYKKLEKATNLKTHFDNVIGIWNHSDMDAVQEVKIKFNGWAASRVMRQPIHATQVIDKKSIDLKNNTLILSIHIKLAAKKTKTQKANERSLELAFLLGRFREFCEVLN